LVVGLVDVPRRMRIAGRGILGRIVGLLALGGMRRGVDGGRIARVRTRLVRVWILGRVRIPHGVREVPVRVVPGRLAARPGHLALLLVAGVALGVRGVASLFVGHETPSSAVRNAILLPSSVPAMPSPPIVFAFVYGVPGAEGE
jgi:hypothetical protein